MSLAQVLGDNIRAYRSAQDLSQEALAYKSRLTPNYLGCVERAQANISVHNLERIARVLKIAPFLLLLPNSSKVRVSIIPLRSS